jgi:succinate-semialdehyde dehydrogenase/glutarate-semialdehyde dehydrogenase
MVAEALDAGAKRITRGFDLPGPSFAAPTLLVDVPEHVAPARREIFGPAAGIFRFDDEDDVVSRANDTEMGLAAYFYTRDSSRTWRLAERLDVGILGVNNPLPSSVFVPLGGTKQSGLGREGAAIGLEEFEETCSIAIGL